MQGIKRKVVYVTLYEAIAIVAASVGFSLFSGQPMSHAGPLAIFCSIVAVCWNLVFNGLFEMWESRQAVKGRSVARRVAHALGFEGGLVVILVPLVAWWLDVSLWHALLMDLGLVVFFLVYTFAFNWGFDRIFGLPKSAMGGAQPASQPA
ncbi:PACE efflux transporter [Variovorax sp. LARHSF232]